MGAFGEPRDRGHGGVTAEMPPADSGPAGQAVLEDSDRESFLTRWSELQASFLDDPRSAVAQSDALVAALTERVTAVFVADRLLLERQWAQAEEPSTEDLRAALQRYRTFFQRLLSV
jgi:hypothetical protein